MPGIGEVNTLLLCIISGLLAVQTTLTGFFVSRLYKLSDLTARLSAFHAAHHPGETV